MPVRPSGVSLEWKFDYTEDYRIDSGRVNEYLRTLFGKYNFFIKVIRSIPCCKTFRATDLFQHVGEEYQFWVPRKLKDVCNIPDHVQATRSVGIDRA